MDTQDYNEVEVFKLLAEGNKEAFTEIYRRYSPEVYRRSLHFLKSPGQAKDIKQEIFLKLWEKRKQIGSVDRFRNYMLVMTQNLVLDRLKEISKEWDLMRDYPKKQDQRCC